MSVAGPDGGGLWKLSAELDAAQADALETLLGDAVSAFSRFAAPSSAVSRPSSAAPNPSFPAPNPCYAAPNPSLWRVEALLERAPDAARLRFELARALAVAPTSLPAIAVERLADVDWLALNRAQFPPVRAGRFFVHGSHFAGPAPADALAIRLDAGPAFGSGSHETTRGCLLAIDALSAERAPRTALDLGCGSGILALAIAKAAGIEVIAADIDPVAVATTRDNAAANGLGERIVAVVEEGVGEDGVGVEVRRRAPYDLIVANILAEPLIGLAPAVAGLLSGQGRLVLSGLLVEQEPPVLAAYRAAGLTPDRIIVLGDWSTMILGRGV